MVKETKVLVWILKKRQQMALKTAPLEPLCPTCVASVSVRFRGEERGTRVKDRAKNGSRFISRAVKSKIPYLGLFLLRN